MTNKKTHRILKHAFRKKVFNWKVFATWSVRSWPSGSPLTWTTLYLRPFFLPFNIPYKHTFIFSSFLIFFPLFQSPLFLSFEELSLILNCVRVSKRTNTHKTRNMSRFSTSWTIITRDCVENVGCNFFSTDWMANSAFNLWPGDFFPPHAHKKKWSTEYFLGVVVFRHAIDFWLVCTDRGVKIVTIFLHDRNETKFSTGKKW